MNIFSIQYEVEENINIFIRFTLNIPVMEFAANNAWWCDCTCCLFKWCCNWWFCKCATAVGKCVWWLIVAVSDAIE